MTARITAFLALAAPLAAATDLAVRSPFGSSQEAPAPDIRENALELRGIMPSGDGVRYCIFDALRNTSTWAAVSEPSANFIIRAADPTAEQVVLEANGRIVTLSLRKSRVATLTPEGNAPVHAISYEPMTRRQPGEPRAPKATVE